MHYIDKIPFEFKVRLINTFQNYNTTRILMGKRASACNKSNLDFTEFEHNYFLVDYMNLSFTLWLST